MYLDGVRLHCGCVRQVVNSWSFMGNDLVDDSFLAFFAQYLEDDGSRNRWGLGQVV